MSLILLLNLLIAMMGDTYADIETDSELRWRVQFAQRLMLAELQARHPHPHPHPRPRPHPHPDQAP